MLKEAADVPQLSSPRFKSDWRPPVASDKSQKKRQKKAPEGLVDQRLIKALGHPLRVRILSILNERICSPNELAGELSKSVGDTSYHVQVLLRMGYIEMVDTKQRRGAVEHFYRGVHRALIPPDAWERLPGNIQQTIAADTFRLIMTDADGALEADAYSNRPDSHVSHTPMILDEIGWDAFIALLANTLDQAFDIQAAATARIAQEGNSAQSLSVTMALAGFESTRHPEDGMKSSATKR
jgi:DNA-binding transcriptional ArsR family regulator